MKNNFLAQVLLGLLGALLLIASVQMFGLGQGLSELEAEAFDPKKLNQLMNQESDAGVSSKQKELYLEQIVALPLFSQTREPFVPPVDVPVPKTGENAVASALDAKVTSIVITGDNSYVMIQDNKSKERLTLAQGMPLEGEQGLWVVSSIEPRKVTFEAEGEEPVELELDVFSGSLGKGGNKNRNKKKNKNNSKAKQITPSKDNVNERANSAEAIRKKIAERRAQMRKEAADRDQK